MIAKVLGYQGIPTTREEAMVVVRTDGNGKVVVWCDPEIADLVDALNTDSLATVASCSGHGQRPGLISLADGRHLLVFDDLDEALASIAHYPDINGKAAGA